MDKNHFELGQLFVNEGQPVISVMCGDSDDPEIVATLEANDPMMVCNRGDGTDYELLERFANLFSAAPDLYLTLNSAVKMLETIGKEDVRYHAPLVIADARKALAKADGRK